MTESIITLLEKHGGKVTLLESDTRLPEFNKQIRHHRQLGTNIRVKPINNGRHSSQEHRKVIITLEGSI